jgi:lipoate-protein ligase A
MATMQGLRVVEFGAYDPFLNMALDTHLLAACEADPEWGFLRFYVWTKPALSLGFFENAGAIDAGRARRDGVEIVRRPTGGRVVLHGDDLTYAVVLPRVRDHDVTRAYRLISECIIDGIALLGPQLELERGSPGKTALRHKPCFVSTSRYEITHEGRKLVGSAQRVGDKAVLQHGSIPLGPSYLDVADYMKCGDREKTALRHGMEKATCSLYDLLPTSVPPHEAAEALKQGFRGRFGLEDEEIRADSLGWDVSALADELRNTLTEAENHGTKPLDSISRAYI